MVYMGSKSHIAKHIVPIIQSYIDKNPTNTVYIEPFVGGANVIDKIKCPLRMGCDLNKYVIALFGHLQNGGELYESVSRELYNEAREDWKNQGGKFKDWELGNIGFLASYNGRFFDGGYSKPVYEKTKNGLRYRDYYQENKRNILKQVSNKEFNKIDFLNLDYRDTISLVSFSSVSFVLLYGINKDIVMYCDPPYQNSKKYNISKNFDYDEFWSSLITLNEAIKNVTIFVSEQTIPDEYKDKFECVWQQEVRRTIKTVEKKKATEKLFLCKKGGD